MINKGISNTPLINYFFYKQATSISSSADGTCFPILSIADAGNGQVLVTTDDTSSITTGVAITILGTSSYDGNYTVISKTALTFNISGVFQATETGTWELSSSITGSNVGDPLDFGKISFYDQTDKITFQNTYLDRDNTIPNPNPIILDANGSFPPIYLLDSPYYIEIRDKFNNIVATLDDYLPIGFEEEKVTEEGVDNLFPNYGFESKVNDDIYEFDSLPAQSTNAVSSGWFWEIDTPQSEPSNHYSYKELANSGLIGNPKNELLLISDNNSGGQTINNLYAIIGSYNMFQDQQLVLSIFTRQISGPINPLQIQLIRTRQGVSESPISIGTIDIGNSIEQQILIFTVPNLSVAGYDNNDELRIVINLPLNENFEYGFTGTWCQISSTGTLSITEIPVSSATAKQLFGRGESSIDSNNAWSENGYLGRGLPISMGEGSSFSLFRTGNVFLGSANNINNKYDNYARPMINDNDPSGSIELVRDQVIAQTKTNRLIDYLRTNDIIQSRNTFVATSVSDVVTVRTGIGAKQKSTWTSLASPRITTLKTVNELIYGLSVIPLGNGKARFIFNDNFNPTTNAFNPIYTVNGAITPPTGNVYTLLPPSAPIITWLGTSYYNRFFVTSFSEAGKNDFAVSTSLSVIQNGNASQPAIVDIWFPDVCTHDPKIYGNQVGALGAGGILSRNSYSAEGTAPFGPLTNYTSYISGRRLVTFESIPSTDYWETSSIQAGFLSYNSPTSNPSTQPLEPARVIRFGNNGRTGSESTATVILLVNDDAATVTTRISNVVNTSWTQTITIASVPNNGDIVEISNVSTDFNLIFWDTAMIRPQNPSFIRKVIYVQFSTSQTTTQIAANTATALNYGVMGIPRAADVALQFYNGLMYYMYL